MVGVGLRRRVLSFFPTKVGSREGKGKGVVVVESSVSGDLYPETKETIEHRLPAHTVGGVEGGDTVIKTLSTFRSDAKGRGNAILRPTLHPRRLV